MSVTEKIARPRMSLERFRELEFYGGTEDPDELSAGLREALDEIDALWHERDERQREARAITEHTVKTSPRATACRRCRLASKSLALVTDIDYAEFYLWEYTPFPAGTCRHVGWRMLKESLRCMFVGRRKDAGA